MHSVEAGNVTFGGDLPLVLIAGPCVAESDSLVDEIAERLVETTLAHGMDLVFKVSYDKANRTSVDSFRGPGLDEGLTMLERVKTTFGVPVMTDIHDVSEAAPVAEVADIIQIPAFLCRQTDLIAAAAETGKPVNVKKGQFMAPWDMENVIRKVRASGDSQVILTERGTSFGYNNLVVDMRSLAVMRSMDVPVVLDATHSVQLPGGSGDRSSGQRQYVEHLARAGAAVGIDGLFLEVHPNPDQALCDGPNALDLADLPALISQVKEIDALVKKRVTADPVQLVA
jgi:2-dehydro-3-deoxyphosphooctonate aldolase (KDO 8-P synthase)